MKAIEDELLKAHQALMCLPTRLLAYGKLSEAMQHIWNALELNNEKGDYTELDCFIRDWVADRTHIG